MQVLASYLERTPALEKDLVLGHEVARAYHYTNRTEVLRGGRQQGSPRPLQTDHIQAEDIVLVDKEGGGNWDHRQSQYYIRGPASSLLLGAKREKRR